MQDDLRNVYDDRYETGYRSAVSGYEIARWAALRDFLPRMVDTASVRKALDYGEGSGMHTGLWTELLPEAELWACDISAVARERFGERYPDAAGRYRLLQGDRADFPDAEFDLVVSVEVMEHVHDLRAYLADVFRLLRPGGAFVWTTPCANRGSIEHVVSRLTGRIDATEEGFRRWRWEDPTHLRRLRTSEATALLRSAGFAAVEYRMRSHFFSYACTSIPVFRHTRLAGRAMMLDYALFRRLPNGASMLRVARKP